MLLNSILNVIQKGDQTGLGSIVFYWFLLRILEPFPRVYSTYLLIDRKHFNLHD